MLEDCGEVIKEDWEKEVFCSNIVEVARMKLQNCQDALKIWNRNRQASDHRTF
jgi:hypothetical protein